LGDVLSVPLYAIAQGNADVAVSSMGVPNVVKILYARLIFPIGTGNNLVYSLIRDITDKVNATGLPPGKDFFVDVVQAGKFVGDGFSYPVYINRDHDGSPLALKLYSNNLTGSPLPSACVYYVATSSG